MRLAHPARLLLSVVLSLLLATWALAQDSAQTPDYDAWQANLEQGQRLLAAESTTEKQLEDLRAGIVAWRSRFLEAESLNSSQIETLQRQIEALGPAPAEGESEPDDIASRRAELEKQLADARAPGLRATEAFSSADGFIREIDKSLRARETADLLSRVATPLNPLNWGPVLDGLRDLALQIPSEINERLHGERTFNQILTNILGPLVLAVVSFYIFVRSRRWASYWEGRVAQLANPSVRMAAVSLVVLLQLALPWAGLVLFTTALSISGLFGPTGLSALRSIPAAGLVLIVGFWLNLRLFPAEDRHAGRSVLDAQQRAAARWITRSIVPLLGLYSFVVVLGDGLDLSALAVDYAGFAVIVAMAFPLFHLGQVFSRTRYRGEDGKSEDDGAVHFEENAIVLIGRIARVVAVLGVMAGCLGYLNIAEAAVISAILSIALFGFLFLLQRTFARLYSLATTGRDEIADGLAPILAGGVLGLVSLPVLALIWGARWTDLTEVWARVREGVVLGDTRLSPEVLFTLILVFALGYGVTRLVQNGLGKTILPKTDLDQGARTALVSGVGYVGIFLAGIAAITSAGLNLSSLAIVAGALSVGIGFGLQTIVSNFVSGIILLIERPVSEGDWIEVNGQMGYVRRIAVRATRIETFDRTDVIVPNSDLISGQVTNWTRGNLVGRVIVPVGVAYGTDTKRVERILQEIAEAHPMVVLSSPPAVLFIGFGADSMDFEIRAIIRDVNFVMNVKSEMNHEIARKFAEEGIEIPFAQRDLWLRNPETLRRAPTSGSGSEMPSQSPKSPFVTEADMVDGDGEADAT